MATTRCVSCNHVYSDIREYNRHDPCPMRVTEQHHQHVILRPPADMSLLLPILQRLCPEDIVEMCRTQHWALKGYWPLVWPGSVRYGREIFSQYTAGMEINNQISDVTSDIISAV